MLSTMAVPSCVMRSASQAGTRPPWSGKSACPERFTAAFSVVIIKAMDRRLFLQTAALAAGAPRAFELEEITITDIQAGLRSGRFTVESLTRKYLDRIKELDKTGPAVNAVIEFNP